MWENLLRHSLSKKSAGRDRARAAKIPPCVHQGGSRLGLPSRRVKWSKSTKTLPTAVGAVDPLYLGIES